MTLDDGTYDTVDNLVVPTTVNLAVPVTGNLTFLALESSDVKDRSTFNNSPRLPPRFSLVVVPASASVGIGDEQQLTAVPQCDVLTHASSHDTLNDTGMCVFVFVRFTSIRRYCDTSCLLVGSLVCLLIR